MKSKTSTDYVPLHKPNQILCGSGKIAIVTGWTPKEAIAKYLSPTEYAAIGALYSPSRGINFLLRNLIANPHLEMLVLLEATKEDKNAGSVVCLMDFFKKGFHLGQSDTRRTCWVINSPIKGYVDSEISSDALEKVREHFSGNRLIYTDTPESAISMVRLLSSKQVNEATLYWSPVQFPIPDVKTTIYPGPRYGHRIEGATIAETWIKILHRIRQTGTLRPTGYDGNWQELVDLMAVVTDEPEEFYFPEPNYLPCDRQTVDQYIPQILEDKPYQPGVKYNYAQRMRSWFGQDQIEAIIRKLIGEIDSASAVINLWDSGGVAHHPATGRRDGDSDHQHGGSPCLTNIWVRIVDRELSLTAIFRSNDMFGAWCSNAMGLRALQHYILAEYCMRVQCHLDGEMDLPYPVDSNAPRTLKMGPLITISQSAHCYDDTFESCDRIIEQYYPEIVKNELKCYHDACGNFVIEILNDRKIKVSQVTTYSGDLVREYQGSNPLVIGRKIVEDNPAIAPSHALYLGLELQKAATCNKKGSAYSQDCPV